MSRKRRVIRPTKKNKRKFSRTANTVKKVNLGRKINRGGIRL